MNQGNVSVVLIFVQTLVSFRWPVRTISFNHTGEYIASASEDLFIDIVRFSFLYTLTKCFNFMPLFKIDQRFLLYILQSHVQTGRSVHQIPCRAAMNSVEWNPKYNLLAYAGDDKNKYQTDEGKVTTTLIIIIMSSSQDVIS